MPTILIKNGDIILKDRILKNSPILIKGGKIAAVGKIGGAKSAVTVNARGCYVSPGFIDTHIHGDPSTILRNEIKHGTTAIVVAESCAPITEIYKKAGRIKEFMKNDPMGHALLGFRIEGPYINKKKAGAQDKRYIKKPDKKELAAMVRRCVGVLTMMTIAPELKGALPLIRLLAKNGIRASIGHSYATCAEAAKGADAGISHATHVFNAMRPTTCRDSGVVGSVMSDTRIWAEIILDRIHVHEALFGLLLQAKGPDRVILITDSVSSCPQKGVKKSGGAYRLRNGALAGSSLTMIKAVQNAVRCGLALTDAVALATSNPARVFGVYAGKGSLGIGKDADLVVFDKNFDVKTTVVHGRIVFRKKGF